MKLLRIALLMVLGLTLLSGATAEEPKKDVKK